MRSEKNGDRASAARAGAVDADEGALGAARPAGREHERERAAAPAATGSQCAAEGPDRRPAPTSPTLWGGHDPPEAPPSRRARQLQAALAAAWAGTPAPPA